LLAGGAIKVAVVAIEVAPSSGAVSAPADFNAVP
jgi:hypothetical protein